MKKIGVCDVCGGDILIHETDIDPHPSIQTGPFKFHQKCYEFGLGAAIAINGKALYSSMEKAK